jgi:DNA helicase II / ATP-dependent DNA helicase PcrA
MGPMSATRSAPPTLGDSVSLGESMNLGDPVSSTSRPEGPDQILAALDPEQREVAAALAGPVCVLAGAGTGKTRAITHRIAYGVLCGIYTPQRVLAVTFTARAAGQMRTRLRGLGVSGVQARTFHAAALRQLGYFWPQVIGGAPPQILEQKARLVADAASRLRLSVDRAAVRDLAAEVEWAKVSMLTAGSYPAAATRAGRVEPGGFDPTTVGRLLEVYEQVKGDRGVIDFEDVLLLTAGILEENAAVAAAVREQYRHFVVDEYQDVSALQQRLLDLWLGGRDDLCVVGDPSQTIYSFTGASPQHLLDFRRRYPQATLVRLVRDYRSTPQVVGLANGLLARAGQVRGHPEPLQLIAQRAAGPPPTLTGYDDDVAEAAGIATRITGLLRDGLAASEIAVLFRTNAQSQALESALTDAGIGYLLRGGERFFARPEVREAVMLLRGAARAATGEVPVGEEVRAVLAAAGWAAQPPAAGGAVRDRWESLQALASLADELAASGPAVRLADVVAELDERASAQHAPTVQGVTLASLHAAKGLEWDAVFLVGLSEGLMPISLAEGWAAVEEERRLLYVGITRAREHLMLSWARARNPGGRAGRQPSRFLDGLLATGSRRETVAARAPKERTRARKLPTSCRVCRAGLDTAAERKIGRCGNCPASYDENLFERLRAWRSATAAQAKVPAYVVFTDATLTAIAEHAPTDPAGLAAIPGVGQTKLERYAAEVLAILRGGQPDPLLQ